MAAGSSRPRWNELLSLLTTCWNESSEQTTVFYFLFLFFLPFWRWLSEFDLDECETRLDLFFIHLAIFELHQWAKVVISNIHWQTSNLIPGDKSQSAQQRVFFFFFFPHRLHIKSGNRGVWSLPKMMDAELFHSSFMLDGRVGNKWTSLCMWVIVWVGI